MLVKWSDAGDFTEWTTSGRDHQQEGAMLVKWSDAGDFTEWTTSARCVHCLFGLQPVRLRRRWVHHFPDTGTIVVCEEKNLKRES